MERFVAILIEHCAGNFPLWLAPEQMIVLPISEKYTQYAEKVLSHLESNNIQGRIDHRDEKIGRKIRDAEVAKVSYMLIIGEKEESTQSVSVRKHSEGDLGQFELDKFVEYFEKEVRISQNL